MNTKIKVAFGVIAGLIVGVMLVGTAVAVPQMMATSAFSDYTMMGAYDRPTITEMNAFMDDYRTSDGSIDIDRMHDDVVSGKVTAPCSGGASGNSAGYGMMGYTY